MDAWMLADGWIRGVSLPKAMGAVLNRLIDHYDHICQIAGNADHIAIGSDLDGAFGTEQSPYDLDTVLPIYKNYRICLTRRGYSDSRYSKNSAWKLAAIFEKCLEMTVNIFAAIVSNILQPLAVHNYFNVRELIPYYISVVVNFVHHYICNSCLLTGS